MQHAANPRTHSPLGRAALWGIIAAAAGVALWRLTEWCFGRSLPGWEICVAICAALATWYGYREQDFQGGMTSVAVTLFVIMAARIQTYACSPQIATPQETAREDIMSALLAQETLDASSIAPSERARQWPHAMQSARERLQSMTPEQIMERWHAFRAQPGQDGPKITYTVYALGHPVVIEAQADDDPPAGVVRRFFATQFSLIDIFVLFVAVTLAFWIGEGRFISILDFFVDVA